MNAFWAVLAVALYAAVAAVVAGLVFRSLLAACVWPPAFYVPRPIERTVAAAHADHYHMPVAFAAGLLWPLSWTILLARHVAYLPQKDKDSAAATVKEDA